MRKKTKIWLAAAIALILAGGVLFVGVMTACGWDFRRLGTVAYITNEYTLDAPFSEIKVDTDTADVTFLPSSDGIGRVVCFEDEDATHAVTVEDGVLRIAVGEKEWYAYIGIDFYTPQVTVYMPAGGYGALSVTTDTGDVTLPCDFQFTDLTVTAGTGDVSCKALVTGRLRITTSTGNVSVGGTNPEGAEIATSTGDITLSDLDCTGDVVIRVSTGDVRVGSLSCKNFRSTGSTGDTVMTGVVAEERFSVERSTGDIRLDGCDGGDLLLKASTGSITGSLLSEKVFLPKSSTGDISVPESDTGGRCEVVTSTGDIVLTVE